MDQRVALVTGSTSGIGAAIARRLADDGFHVVVHSGSSVDEGERLAEDLDGSYLQADLSDADAAMVTVAGVLADLGRLDVLVNNAGVSRPIPHDDLAAATPQEWREVLEVNLVAPFALTTVAEPYLRKVRGCVVNVTSHAGVRPKGSSIPYAASKAALNHVTRLLAAALGPEIRVTRSRPGWSTPRSPSPGPRRRRSGASARRCAARPHPRTSRDWSPTWSGATT